MISAALLAPLLIVIGHLFIPDVEAWHHLIDTVLADYVLNSLVLTVGVALGALFIGTSTAWLMTQYEFWGRGPLRFLLLLPLAMPAYIIAYTYTGMLDVSGWVQLMLRESLGWQYGDYWFPDVRSMPFAIGLMALVLYPYVYMLARTAFSEQGVNLREVSLTMGLSKTQHFYRVSLPLARPALLTGAALAMMEALADYGTVQYFGINTFTTGIFRSWYAMGNRTAATQLAGVLCLFVLLVLVLEQHGRRQLKYYQKVNASSAQEQRIRLSGWRAGVTFLVCVTPVLLGFLIPLLQLIYWAINVFELAAIDDFISLALGSFSLAAVTALVVVTLAVLFSYQLRWHASFANRWQVRLLSLGYALPGMVIAVGALIMLGQLDQWLNHFTYAVSGNYIGLLLSGSLFALVFCYSIRFLSVALQNTEAGIARISPSIDDAAQTLGASRWRIFHRIHSPLLRTSVLTAGLLVFVDVLKELPATLVLRPFNFNTLAVRTYELASDERLFEAALPALTIVLVGLLPIIIITRTLDKRRT